VRRILGYVEGQSVARLGDSGQIAGVSISLSKV
jgi:hypothetical protein